MTDRALLAVLAICLYGPALVTAEPVQISEWQIPWKNTRPMASSVDQDGRVWFTGQRGDFIANLTPESGEFARYDLPPDSEPEDLLLTEGPALWFAATGKGYIGHLDPATGRIIQVTMPDRHARDPGTLALDASGNIWFTVHDGNYVGKLTVVDVTVQLIELPSRRSRPTGIAVNSHGEPWVAASGTNKLLRIDPDEMAVYEIELPNRGSRPQSLVISSDDAVWWVDAELGSLGRLDPQSGAFEDWPMPGGDDSEPLCVAIDREDRLWIVESGLSPNRFVGFDPRERTFFSATDIPSGGGGVLHMYYYEPAGEIWFATGTNYIGRADVH